MKDGGHRGFSLGTLSTKNLKQDNPATVLKSEQLKSMASPLFHTKLLSKEAQNMRNVIESRGMRFMSDWWMAAQKKYSDRSNSLGCLGPWCCSNS